jgi:reductive dehalogenase
MSVTPEHGTRATVETESAPAVEREGAAALGSEAPAAAEAAPDFSTPPDLGRTVRVVGPVVNVDTSQLPHPKNQRGELGKALFNWYHNTVSKDPLTRVSAPNHFADRRHYLINVVGRAPKGEVNPERVPVSDPAVMTAHIKRVARYMGADIVAVARTHPAFLYAGSRYLQEGAAEDSYEQDSPAELARKFPYVVTATVTWDYNLLQAHRHHIGDAAYHVSQMRASMIVKALEGYIRELGYTALRGVANPQGAALAGGVGELGRNGMVISKDYGARIHLPDPIMTDLPLVADRPIDIGVEEFCKICRKCAITCPTNSITFEDKVVHNGIQKYKIKWETCYRLRPFVSDHWGSCLTCVTVCPYTKPNVWWRGLAVRALSACPPAARPPLVRALKWADDRFWGEVPQKRVRWLGYDSGIKPGERACTVAGCTATHAEGSRAAAAGDIGYYAPLKENTNRFVKRGGG